MDKSDIFNQDKLVVFNKTVRLFDCFFTSPPGLETKALCRIALSIKKAHDLSETGTLLLANDMRINSEFQRKYVDCLENSPRAAVIDQMIGSYNDFIFQFGSSDPMFSDAEQYIQELLNNRFTYISGEDAQFVRLLIMISSPSDLVRRTVSQQFALQVLGETRTPDRRQELIKRLFTIMENMEVEQRAKKMVVIEDTIKQMPNAAIEYGSRDLIALAGRGIMSDDFIFLRAKDQRMSFYQNVETQDTKRTHDRGDRVPNLDCTGGLRYFGDLIRFIEKEEDELRRPTKALINQKQAVVTGRKE